MESNFNTVGAVRSDLGTPSSASGVTGADSFSKINTLNNNKTDFFDAGNITATSESNAVALAIKAAFNAGFINATRKTAIVSFFYNTPWNVSVIDNYGTNHTFYFTAYTYNKIVQGYLGANDTTCARFEELAIDSKIGTVPSGQTVEGQISSLSSNINTTYRDIYGNGSINNCNNAEIGKWYHIYPSASNVPIQATGILFTYGNSGDKHQICESGSRYFVRRYTDGAWTDWAELALSSNTGKVTLDTNVFYQKRGNVCTVWCHNRSFSDTTTFGTLPAGCRPANEIRQINYDGSCLLYIGTDGTVAGMLAPGQSGTKYLITCCITFVVA